MWTDGLHLKSVPACIKCNIILLLGIVAFCLIALAWSTDMWTDGLYLKSVPADAIAYDVVSIQNRY